MPVCGEKPDDFDEWMAGKVGLEPTANRLEVWCSVSWATKALLLQRKFVNPFDQSIQLLMSQDLTFFKLW